MKKMKKKQIKPRKAKQKTKQDHIQGNKLYVLKCVEMLNLGNIHQHKINQFFLIKRVMKGSRIVTVWER